MEGNTFISNFNSYYPILVEPESKAKEEINNLDFCKMFGPIGKVKETN